MNPSPRTPNNPPLFPTSYFLIPIFQLLFIGPIFSQELNLNYWEINQLKVESVTQWTIVYYDNGEERGRSINKQWFYNEDGDLDETRTSYTPDGSEWVTTTYYYKDHRLVKEKIDSPYEPVITAPLRLKQVLSKCETYNDRGQPIGAVLTYDDRSMETWAYTYLKADRYSRLLGWKRIFEDGTLKRAVMYEYGYRE